MGTGLDAIQGGTARRVGGRVFSTFAKLLGDRITALVPVPFISPGLLEEVDLSCALTIWIELPTHQEVWR